MSMQSLAGSWDCSLNTWEADASECLLKFGQSESRINLDQENFENTDSGLSDRSQSTFDSIHVCKLQTGVGSADRGDISDDLDSSSSDSSADHEMSPPEAINARS
jgi:hypothetical protein